MAGLRDKGIVKGASFMKIDNRINYYKVAPEALEHIMAMERYIRKAKLDKNLAALIKVYVSRLNGCSFCIEMHTKEAEKRKVPDELIVNVTEFETSDLYDDQTKVTLELSKHITYVSKLRVEDALYDRARKYYDEKQYVDLVMLINQINTWNRLSIAMGNHAKNQ